MTDAHHECFFPEVKIAETDGDLTKGDLVLGPCSCGETPLDALALAAREIEETQRAFAHHLIVGDLPIFHWSPVAKRKQIIRHGLRPRMRPTTHPQPPGVQYRWPYICFADTPSLAWALSGAQPSAPSGEWDLWQCWLGRLTEPLICPSPNDERGIHEIRTHHRVYKRDLWHVATRHAPDPEKENT